MTISWTNPFKYIAGSKALLWGLAIMLVTAFIARYSNARFDGAIDMHVVPGGTWALHLLEPLIDWGCVAATFFLAARIASRSRVRLIDIAGTTALSRAPLILAALAAFLQRGEVKSVEDLTATFWVVALISLGAAIWMIILLYNAFTVSANLKGTKAAVSFTIALIAAEILSKVLLSYLYTII